MTDNDRSAEMMLEVDRLISESRIADAMALLDEILAETPDFGRAHNHMGWIYDVKLKVMSKAEEHYRLSIKFSPDYPAGYTNYAYLLSSQRRFEELENLLQTASKCPGINMATISNEYGIMYETMGRFEEAITSYKRYILNAFDEKMIDTAVANVQRCKRKKELLATL